MKTVLKPGALIKTKFKLNWPWLSVYECSISKNYKTNTFDRDRAVVFNKRIYDLSTNTIFLVLTPEKPQIVNDTYVQAVYLLWGTKILGIFSSGLNEHLDEHFERATQYDINQ